MHPRSRTTRALAAAALAGGLALTGIGQLPANAGSTDAFDDSRKLRKDVNLADLEAHLEKFQAIADKHGNRFAGMKGYDKSAAHAAKVLEKAGYKVRAQEFDYLAAFVTGPATLEQVAPTATTYVEETDFTYMDQTDPGDVTAAVTAVDLALGPDNASSSGCEAADFAGFPAGNIALMQRGTCAFEDKVENAAAAGAVGAIVINQGNTEERKGLEAVTLGSTNESGIPALFATYDLGVAWSQTPGLELRMVTQTVREMKSTHNVLATATKRHLKKPKSKAADRIVMVGAHLDGVPEGAAINDNGTGSAAVLEIAKHIAKQKTKHRTRFALWSAEESGLIGAEEYVAALSKKAAKRIELYLNFDMIGSPNFVRFIYDGDNSAFPVGPDAAEAPAGSDVIEDVFAKYFKKRGLASAETAFSGRSDYGPFIAIGIPAGGLFTGAEGIKTEEEAELFGGEAGVAYDACYHQACDDLDNVDRKGFHQMADAAAHATLTFARDLSAVKKARSNAPAPTAPRAAASADGHHGHALTR